MKVYYWSPFINEVATIKAVTNSIFSIKKFSKKKIVPEIIDAVGEWDSKKNYLAENDIKIVKLYNFNLIRYLPKYGYIKSRFTYFVICLLTIYKLHSFIKRHKPDYLIVHLLTYIPLFLLSIFNYKTKFILRISGYPRLTFIRKLFWKLVGKKLYLVTTPTKFTAKMIIEKKVFEKNKVKYLPDPILKINEIQKKKNTLKKVEEELSSNNSLISIGRLTPQKNFNFLIKVFYEISKEYKSLNLFILGEGEEKNKLKALISKLNLTKKVFLVGYKDNIYDYLKKSKIFILPSLWEDPGFVLLEAAYLNKTILSSNCPNGPVEILDSGRNGYLFKSNSLESFKSNFTRLLNTNENDILRKKIKLKKKCKEFTLFNHYKILVSILKK